MTEKCSPGWELNPMALTFWVISLITRPLRHLSVNVPTSKGLDLLATSYSHLVFRWGTIVDHTLYYLPMCPSRQNPKYFYLYWPKHKVRGCVSREIGEVLFHSQGWYKFLVWHACGMDSGPLYGCSFVSVCLSICLWIW